MTYQEKKELIKEKLKVDTDTELAIKLELKGRQNINYWNVTQSIPPIHALKIEELTNGEIKAINLIGVGVGE
jgi:hypothetical protein